VLNKLDLLPEDEREARCQAIIDGLGWTGPVYRISAISGEGTKAMCGDIMTAIEAQREAEAENPELAERELDIQSQMQAESREKIEGLSAARKNRRLAEEDEFDDEDDDEAEYEYVR
jgi:GTP-binding protein